MMKLGVLGGTFNPIHIGHLIMAEQAMEQFGLHKVLFLQSKNPPHKNKKGILPDAVRKEMILLAIESNERFEFSDLELHFKGINYTVDTLKQLREQDSESEIYFIMGADSLFQFATWKEPKRILKIATILAASRDGTKELEMKLRKNYLEGLFGGQIELIQMTQTGVSSKEIRMKRKQGESIRYLVPDAVYRYIMEKELYAT